MFDIKQNKPTAKVPIFVSQCLECRELFYSINIPNLCCEKEMNVVGDFEVTLKYSTAKSTLSANVDYVDFLKEHLLGWSDLGSGKSEFKYSKKNIELLCTEQPKVSELLFGLCHNRVVFGMIDLTIFKKKLKTQSNGRLNGEKGKNTRLTAENV